MDYENKNKDAISTIKQALRQLATNGVPVGNMIKAINDIEEKYAESEDERIRNFLIKQANSVLDSITDDDEEVPAWKSALAWLEKQGENNMGISEATKKKLEDNLNKALEKETPESWNKFLEKQGEQKPTIEMITPEESLGVDSDTYNKIVDECIYGEQKLTDKVNSNLLTVERAKEISPFMKTVFENEPTDKVAPRQEELTEFEKAVKQVMEEAIECGDTHNLKADADMLLRIARKTSWSEEDEEQLDRALYMMEQLDMTKSWDDVYNWLKSLKDRYTWKPSDEQMLAINTAINVLGKGTINGKCLIELQEQLLKLMEE